MRNALRVCATPPPCGGDGGDHSDMRNGSRFPVRRGVNANQNLMKSITSSSVGSIRSFEYFKPRYRNLALQQQQQQPVGGSSHWRFNWRCAVVIAWIANSLTEVSRKTEAMLRIHATEKLINRWRTWQERSEAKVYNASWESLSQDALYLCHCPLSERTMTQPRVNTSWGVNKQTSKLGFRFALFYQML